MNTKLFEINTNIKTLKEKISLYSTQKSMDKRNESLKDRLNTFQKTFDIAGKVIDNGNEIVITQKNKSLSLYAGSDSFWFENNDLFATEKKAFSKTLPNESLAKELAFDFIKKNNFLKPNIQINKIDYTSVAISRGEKSKIEEFNTEINVHFDYLLDDLPLFGTGAKTKISFISKEKISNVYHFWRDYSPISEEREVFTNEFALEVFTKNFRFANLNSDTSKVMINSLDLGYYSLAPTEIQNFLIPVYQVRGEVITRDLPSYKFKHYIVALKYSDDDLKSMGMSVKGKKAMVF